MAGSICKVCSIEYRRKIDVFAAPLIVDDTHQRWRSLPHADEQLEMELDNAMRGAQLGTTSQQPSSWFRPRKVWLPKLWVEGLSDIEFCQASSSVPIQPFKSSMRDLWIVITPRLHLTDKALDNLVDKLDWNGQVWEKLVAASQRKTVDGGHIHGCGCLLRLPVVC